MKKKIIAFMLAMSACLSVGTVSYNAPLPASALTLIAEVNGVTADKNELSIGESTQISVDWGYGTTYHAEIYSDDTSVIKIENIADDFTSCTVTGVGVGTAEVIVSNDFYYKSIEITVKCEEKIYNTSELELGQKLFIGDTLHYDEKNVGSIANIINDKGSYDLAFLNSEDYVLPFNAEVVGFDGLTVYLAPEIDGINYSDARTLEVGDVISKDTHLLCYDYVINSRVLPVFLPEYYEMYIGDGTIKVKSIDHENKRIKLESVNDNSIDDILPETLDEHTAFIEQYGLVSVHGKYIVYCDRINYSTGAEVILEQLGTGEIKKINEYSVTTDEELDGAPDDIVYVYEALKPGTVKVTISQSRPWALEESQQIRKIGYYEISDDLMSIKEIKEDDFVEPVKGDVNADGELSVADVVTFQKWLIGTSDIDISNLGVADFYEDGKLNVFDLCMMKRHFISQVNHSNSYQKYSVTDVRTNADSHIEWLGYLANSEASFNEIIQQNEGTDISNDLPDGISEDMFANKSVLVIYSTGGAGNQYSIIDDIDINNNIINISTTTKAPIIATPDMCFRRYIFIVEGINVDDISEIIFDDTYLLYEYEDESTVSKWFKEWCES